MSNLNERLQTSRIPNMPDQRSSRLLSEPVSTDNENWPAYIYRPPNEILYLIFTFLFLMPGAIIPIRHYATTPSTWNPLSVYDGSALGFEKSLLIISTGWKINSTS